MKARPRCFGTGGGHAVVGYGIERGEWEWDGVTYDRRIRTWDCNYSEQTDKSQFYFDSNTLHWCIPAYGVYYAGETDFNARVGVPCGDAEALNPYPYFASSPLAGDADLSGTVELSDAIFLAKFICEQADSTLSYRGAYNADSNADGLMSIDDAIAILRIITTESNVGSALSLPLPVDLAKYQKLMIDVPNIF